MHVNAVIGWEKISCRNLYEIAGQKMLPEKLQSLKELAVNHRYPHMTSRSMPAVCNQYPYR